MVNIFRNANFGDKFRTRDGREAIFSHIAWSDKDKKGFAYLMIPNYLRGLDLPGSHNVMSLKVTLDGLADYDVWHTNNMNIKEKID